MPHASDRAASRHSRDRDLLPAGPRMGPYELRYDVRRGYERPLKLSADAPPADVLLFRAREDDDIRPG
ncbi:MAG TPA: hypothetical protein VEQ60_25300 [Longimicrobium sp.]|nr:hypothetical protein [Longimicrobium sp.]